MNTTAIFLTYATRPHFAERDYEGWLRTHDNPFFNAIEGIGRYENWKLPEADPALGFDYFDMIYLDDSRPLRDVWFDEALTGFRRNWVKLWGYGSGPPPAVNAQGYLMSGPAAPALGAVGEGSLAFGPGAGGIAWTITETMPKHYAYPADQIPDPWRRPAADLPLPGATVRLAENGEVAEGGMAAVRIAP